MGSFTQVIELTKQRLNITAFLGAAENAVWEEWGNNGLGCGRVSMLDEYIWPRCMATVAV